MPFSDSWPSLLVLALHTEVGQELQWRSIVAILQEEKEQILQVNLPSDSV